MKIQVAVARALTRLTSITVEAFASFVTKGSHPSCLVLAQYMLGQTEVDDNFLPRAMAMRKSHTVVLSFC